MLKKLKTNNGLQIERRRFFINCKDEGAYYPVAFIKYRKIPHIKKSRMMPGGSYRDYIAQYQKQFILDLIFCIVRFEYLTKMK